MGLMIMRGPTTLSAVELTVIAVLAGLVVALIWIRTGKK